jgi:hypothetical protein
MPRLKKFSRKRLMEVLQRLDRFRVFANVNVIARESENSPPMVEMELQKLVQEEKAVAIKIAAYHPETGELGEETCYRLGVPVKPRMSDIYMRIIDEEDAKKRKRRR